MRSNPTENNMQTSPSIKTTFRSKRALVLLTSCAIAHASLTSTAMAQSEETHDLDIYSSGVDAQRAPLTQGTTDTHWEVREGQGTWQPAVYDKNNYCSSCGGIWLDHPLGDHTLSRPIVHPSFRQQTAPNRLFSYRTSFSLPPGADTSTATITYRVGFDDVSRDATGQSNLSGCNHTVWLNGLPLQMTSTGNNMRTECQATIPKGSNFVVGDNTLEFHVFNISTYYGFRFEVESASYDGDAEPPLFINLDTPVDASATADDTPEITGSASVDATLTLNIEDASGVLETLTPALDVNGRYAIEAPPLVDGVYYLSAIATRGNEQASAGPHAFTIDTIPPALTVDTPADGAFVATPMVTIEGACEPGARLTLVLSDADGALLASSIISIDETGQWVFAPEREIPGGALSLTAVATDDVGNETVVEHTFSIYLDTPSVTITSPVRGMFLETSTPTITGDAIDSDEVEVLVDNSSVGKASVLDDGSWSFAVPQSLALAPGAHTLEAIVTAPWDNPFSSGVIPIAIREPMPMMEEPANNTSSAGANNSNIDPEEPGLPSENNAAMDEPDKPTSEAPMAEDTGHEVEDGCQIAPLSSGQTTPPWALLLALLGLLGGIGRRRNKR